MVNHPHHLLYILFYKDTPAGYILWNRISDDPLSVGLYNKVENDDELANRVLRQVFIRKEYRNKGLGTMLLKETVQREVPEGKKFLVEEPNIAASKLLIKCGFENCLVI